jgi:hypothetical protein
MSSDRVHWQGPDFGTKKYVGKLEKELLAVLYSCISYKYLLNILSANYPGHCRSCIASGPIGVG